MTREHPFAAKTEAGRKAQVSNLRPNAHTSHGVYSIERLAPLRAQHEAELAEDYPNLDRRRRRRSLLADRLSRVELASAWVREHGLVRNSRGDVFPIADRLENWSSRSEDMLEKAEQQRREQGTGPAVSLEEHLAANYGTGVDGSPAEVVDVEAEGDGER